MALTAVMKVGISNAYAALAPFVGLATSTPGASASPEPTGTGRVASNWGTPNASTGVMTGAPSPMNVAAGQAVAGVQYWSAQTGGTYMDGATVTSQSFASAGTYTVTPTETPN